MNRSVADKETGEIYAVITTPFLTRYDKVGPTLIDVDSESCVDTTLYQPLNEVIERCERAGMLRELLGGAQGLQYDSKEEISDDELDELTPVSGDMFEDVNDIMSVYDASVVASNASERASKEKGSVVPENSSEATSEQEKAVSVDVDE